MTERLPRLVSEWPPPAREAWEERAAIMEFDGGLSRADAEAAAEDCVRRELGESPAVCQDAPWDGW